MDSPHEALEGPLKVPKEELRLRCIVVLPKTITLDEEMKNVSGGGLVEVSRLN